MASESAMETPPLSSETARRSPESSRAKGRVANPDAPLGFRSVERSRVLPGLTRDDLAHLLSGVPSLADARRLARNIAEALVLQFWNMLDKSR